MKILLIFILVVTLVSGRQFKNRETGFCLNTSGAGKLYTSPCHHDHYQNWDWKSDSSIRNRNIVNSMYCLDARGSSLGMKECGLDTSLFQKWVWTSGGEVRNKGTSYCLSDYKGKVYPMICNGKMYQKWVLL